MTESLPMAILAGGLATRLRPITEKIPKALVDVAGEPFIARQLRYVREQGVTRVVLCVGYLGEQVEALLGDGRSLGMQIRYAYDGPRLLGTGGALRKALPLLGESFFVLYGDSYLPIEFAPIESAFRASGMPSLMTVLRNAGRWDRSNVEYAGGKVILYDKRSPAPSMDYIDYGLNVLSSRVLEGYPVDEPFDIADVFHGLSKRGELAGFEVHTRFYEVGSHEGLAELEKYFSGKGNP